MEAKEQPEGIAMSEREKRGQPPRHTVEKLTPDDGELQSREYLPDFDSRRERSEYMAGLGGGTGVDIGPGAAGEMSDVPRPQSHPYRPEEEETMMTDRTGPRPRKEEASVDTALPEENITNEYVRGPHEPYPDEGIDGSDVAGRVSWTPGAEFAASGETGGPGTGAEAIGPAVRKAEADAQEEDRI
jgi:hypothetical protein